MVKILAIGDPHSKRGNQDELKECADRIVGLILTHAPKAVVILGDLANDHEKVYITALNGIVNFLDSICTAMSVVQKHSGVNTKVFYIVGNHDAQHNQIFLDDGHAFNAFKKWGNLVVVDKPMIVKADDSRLVMCPYVPPGRFVEALDTIGRDKWTSASVVFCHQEFYNANLGNIPSKNGDKWEDSLPYVVSGHIHTYQQLQDNVLYVGAPYDINFGDEGEKTVSLIEVGNGRIENQERLYLGMPRKITIHMSVDDAMGFDVTPNTKTRLYVTGTTQDFAKFKKSQKYQELIQVVKIIPQITDQVSVMRQTTRKSYIDILKEECQKENSFVKEALADITGGCDNETNS